MEWSIILLNLTYAIMGVILMYVSFRVFDRLTVHVPLEKELAKGNVAVAIVIGSLFLAIAIIISGALN